MNKNQLIGFAVLGVGGIVVLKFLAGLISSIIGIALLAGAAYFGYNTFFKKG